MDHNAEIALDPGKAKVVIYYPHSKTGQLVTLIWEEDLPFFSRQVGDEPPEYEDIYDPENIYTTSTHMAAWLDQWRDLNES